MTSFTYYITDLFEGCIVGTNSEELAKQVSESENYYVVNAKTGEWLLPDGKLEKVIDYDTETEKE